MAAVSATLIRGKAIVKMSEGMIVRRKRFTTRLHTVTCSVEIIPNMPH